MLFGSLFPRDVLAELDRLQRELQQSFEISPSIRGFGRGGFPALNVGGTSQSIEIYAFAPGIDASTLEVNLDRGLLTIAGERKADLPGGNGGDAKVNVHINERFHGQFRRVLTLPDDVDANSVDAKYRDGIVHISIKRREEAQPRRISVH